MIRLTIICNEEELSKYQACVQSYASHNKAFNQKCCRLLCITNGARNGEINVGGTLVSFIPASTNFNCYEDVLNYMRPAYQAVPTYIPNERLYYSARHARLN